ncbi:MAG TPA: chorismate mutase [Acidobacteriota bacterium]|nr:chorismate mutase [Acidobacteriota bacterium]
MTLQEIRERIDELDREILGLLDRRMELARRSGKLKAAVRDEEREAQVLDRVGRWAESRHRLLRADFAKALYVVIMGESRRIQEEEREDRP